MVKIINPIDKYIKGFPDDVQTTMQKIRKAIKTVAPKAEETINYGIPSFKLNGKYLVHFGGWKKHIGFYPTPSGTVTYKKELAKYESGKGSVKFPLDQPIPYELIKKIVKFRMKDILARVKK